MYFEGDEGDLSRTWHAMPFKSFLLHDASHCALPPLEPRDREFVGAALGPWQVERDWEPLAGGRVKCLHFVQPLKPHPLIHC